MSEQGPFFTAAEVADYLGIHEKQVYRLMKRGGLPGTRVTGKWLFPKVLIDRYIMDSAGGRGGGARPVVIASDDDPLFEAIAAGWTAVADSVLARVPATMERGLLLFASGRVDGVVIEHAADGCRGSIDRRLRRVLGPLVDELGVQRLRLGRRQLGIAARTPRTLAAFADQRIAIREHGSATRTLVEHQLLRAGASAVHLERQPVVTSHRAALEAVLRGDVDAAVVPVSEAERFGLVVVAIAVLEQSLIVGRGLLERELRQLPQLVAGSLIPQASRDDRDGAGIVTAIAAEG